MQPSRRELLGLGAAVAGGLVLGFESAAEAQQAPAPAKPAPTNVVLENPVVVTKKMADDAAKRHPGKASVVNQVSSVTRESAQAAAVAGGLAGAANAPGAEKATGVASQAGTVAQGLGAAKALSARIGFGGGSNNGGALHHIGEQVAEKAAKGTRSVVVVYADVSTANSVADALRKVENLGDVMVVPIDPAAKDNNKDFSAIAAEANQVYIYVHGEEQPAAKMSAIAAVTTGQAAAALALPPAAKAPAPEGPNPKQ